MQRKEYYRSYFANVSRYVKMMSILKDMGMAPTNFYRFMKGSEWDYIMSVEMLDRIHDRVKDTLKNFT